MELGGTGSNPCHASGMWVKQGESDWIYVDMAGTGWK